jgi:hypothetical protein
MSSIEFTQECYDNDTEKMYQDVAKQLLLLHKNGYDCRVWSDCGEVVVIEYDFHNRFASSKLCWLTEDEIDAVNEYKDNLKRETEK